MFEIRFGQNASAFSIVLFAVSGPVGCIGQAVAEDACPHSRKKIDALVLGRNTFGSRGS